MTERERIEAVLRTVPLRYGYTVDSGIVDYPAMARAVVERVVGPLEQIAKLQRAALDVWKKGHPHEQSPGACARDLADRDARLARLVAAAEMIKKMFHPEAPGWGTCSVCKKAGGAHCGDCPIGVTVAALDDKR